MHGFVRVGRDLPGVGIIQQEHPHALEALALRLGAAVEDRGQLFPGDRVGGAEGPVAVAQDDALGGGPVHGLGQLALGGHVVEVSLGVFSLFAAGAVKGQDRVASGEGFFPGGHGRESEGQHQNEDQGQRKGAFACLHRLQFLLCMVCGPGEGRSRFLCRFRIALFGLFVHL